MPRSQVTGLLDRGNSLFFPVTNQIFFFLPPRLKTYPEPQHPQVEGPTCITSIPPSVDKGTGAVPPTSTSWHLPVQARVLTTARPISRKYEQAAEPMTHSLVFTSGLTVGHGGALFSKALLARRQLCPSPAECVRGAHRGS